MVISWILLPQACWDAHDIMLTTYFHHSRFRKGAAVTLYAPTAPWCSPKCVRFRLSRVVMFTPAVWRVRYFFPRKLVDSCAKTSWEMVIQGKVEQSLNTGGGMVTCCHHSVIWAVPAPSISIFLWDLVPLAPWPEVWAVGLGGTEMLWGKKTPSKSQSTKQNGCISIQKGSVSLAWNYTQNSRQRGQRLK